MIELIEVAASSLPDDVLDFSPIECMECQYNGHIPRQFFKTNQNISNEKEYNELRSLVKKKLGFESFSECYCNDGLVISVCRCPKCGSEEIFEDF